MPLKHVSYCCLYKRDAPNFSFQLESRWGSRVKKGDIEQAAIERQAWLKEPNAFAWVGQRIYQCLYYTEEGKISYAMEYYLFEGLFANVPGQNYITPGDFSLEAFESKERAIATTFIRERGARSNGCVAYFRLPPWPKELGLDFYRTLPEEFYRGQESIDDY